jgi:hypothetical protein
MMTDGLIMAGGDDLLICHKNRSNRNLASITRVMSLHQSHLHELCILLIRHEHLPNS